MQDVRKPTGPRKNGWSCRCSGADEKPGFLFPADGGSQKPTKRVMNSKESIWINSQFEVGFTNHSFPGELPIDIGFIFNNVTWWQQKTITKPSGCWFNVLEKLWETPLRCITTSTKISRRILTTPCTTPPWILRAHLTAEPRPQLWPSKWLQFLFAGGLDCWKNTVSHVPKHESW